MVDSAVVDAVGHLEMAAVASSAFVGAFALSEVDYMYFVDCLSFVITLLSLVSTNLAAISSTDVYLYLLHLDKILSLIVP